ncbi:MAG: nickel pincer cofactor biosynthesis protein LarC [Bacillota bacterium]
MSKIIYFDCPTGISGDMALAALIDCGADLTYLRQQLNRLPLPAWNMECKIVHKNGLAASQMDISYEPAHKCHHLHHIEEIISSAQFPARAEELALKTFRHLAAAEAKAHGCTIEKVHFHEVGATDTILDICGATLALDYLGIDNVYASPLPLSHGFADCAHGRIPIPAPAVLELLNNAKICTSTLQGELITPTGAAILMTALAPDGFEAPQFALQKTGLGAGQKDLPIPNILRAMLGITEYKDSCDIITCWIDDCQPEILGYLWQKILTKDGALDMAYSPIFMKKGRPAWQISLIATGGQGQKLASIILQETSAIGLRIHREQRLVLPRKNVQIDTPYGKIEVKVSGTGPEQNIAPEYESCAQAAAKYHQPLKTIYQAAIAAFLKHKQEEY